MSKLEAEEGAKLVSRAIRPEVGRGQGRGTDILSYWSAAPNKETCIEGRQQRYNVYWGEKGQTVL